MYTILLESEGDRDTYDYATQEELSNGFFRLYASSVAYYRKDGVAREISGPMLYVRVDSVSAAEHPELTMPYRDWLYSLDEDELTKERERWESLHDYD